jgi:hypothetical protein
MPRHTTATIRNIALIGGALAVAVTLAGCGGPKPTGSGALSGSTGAPAASSTPSASVSPSPVATVTVTAPEPAPYPSNYPAAILAAWKAKDTARLAQLTSASTANHLINDLGSVNQDWIHIRDDGAMGSSYASYYNTKGDLLVLRIGNEAVSEKKYHAGSLQTYDKMTYPADAVAYVKEFVNGWLDGNADRMRLLSSDTITTHYLGLSMPDTDFTAAMVLGSGAAGHVEIEVKETSPAFDQTLKVATPLLLGAHAIEDCDPSCS